MHNALRSFFSTFLDLLAPPRATDAIVRTLTPETLRNFEVESGLPYHQKEVSALVWEIKYHANPQALLLAGERLAEELQGVAGEEIGRPLLVPVPMHERRRRERGHNQTELLCEAAIAQLRSQTTGSRRSGPLGQVLPTPSDSLAPLDYAPDVLVRVRATPPQQGLPKHVRLKNIKNSMRAEGPDAGRIAGRVCVVVDDVTTTGATFAECKRALKAAGARSVHCVALAHS